ncbi:MAG: hypothetical protein NVSMB44_22240 [Ktedonobacteraceae bacterium]
MVVAAAIAQDAGLFAAADAMRQNQLLAALGLPVEYRGPIQKQDILATMQLDKKVVGKRMRWIMPTHIGEVIVSQLPDELVARVISAFFVARGEKV